MKDILTELHTPCLMQCGFYPDDDHGPYNREGACFSVLPEKGQGRYWTYTRDNLFSISIQDFVFYEDLFLEFQQPKYLSFNYYDSVSGEEFNPYKRLSSGCIRVHIGYHNLYRASYRKNIPIRSTAIEIMPEYYEDYLKSKYPVEYKDLRSSFITVDGMTNFAELVFLLRQIRSFRGTGIAAKLYYEGKVAEAVSLIVEKAKAHKKTHPSKSISRQDMDGLTAVTAYIDDHFSSEIHLEHLARIACMGLTKLKYTFKQANQCTITEYIQNKRMNHAEQLLTSTDLHINQIAYIVGYHNSSRFSQLFRKSTGLLPNEYRRFTVTTK
ncbi:DNA-binding domain-containing protein, AraC-type [Brevibacillus sp. IT-7CA2]|uniref:helix-turn-helix domain-containing protein n=1 Tax=Brevibacillus sp. IT-7CA2 TaxID=3026436 RepID=UPI0039DF9C79